MAANSSLFAVCALLTVPVAVGALAVFDLWRFRRDSFGLYARSTGLLAAGIAVGLCYYGIVVLSFGLAGGLDEMVTWPLSPLGALLYLQAGMVTAAVVLLRAGGRRLAQITHPGAGT